MADVQRLIAAGLVALFSLLCSAPAWSGTIIMVPDNSVLAVGVFHNVYNSPGIALSGSTACGSYTYQVSSSNKYQFTCNNTQGQPVQSGQQEWQCPDPHNSEGYSTVANRTDDNAPVCSQSTTMHCADPTATPDTSAGAAPNTCVCPGTSVDDGTHKHCTSPCTQYAGKPGGDYEFDTNIKAVIGADGFASNAPASTEVFICAGVPNAGASSSSGCTVSMQPNTTYPRTFPSGSYWVQSGPTKYTGDACDPTAAGNGGATGTPAPTAPSPSIPPGSTVTAGVSPCPAGQVQGTFNGATMCLPAGTNTPVLAPSSGAGGSSSSTTTTTGPDGQPVTTTTTKSTDAQCSNGQCVSTTTVTVTSSVSSGTPTSTTTQSVSSGSLGEFCKGNPANAICGGGGGNGTDSTWGGSCMSGFQCSGDAVQCAAAQGVWQQKCALIDGPSAPTSEDSVFAAAKAGSAASSTLGTDTVELGPGNFDSSNSLGVSAQCLADVAIVVWGKSVTLPFSTVCPYLAIMGSILLAIAWLMAAVIVGKGIQGGVV